jgi:membrane protease subunit HflK
MAGRKIIFGDTEINIPDRIATLGLIPIIGIIIVLWLLSGIYSVGPDEVGVVRTFGKVTRVAQSGLRYHLPYPIEQVDTPKVTEVKRTEIGFRHIGNQQFRKVEYESLMLTGDENIVDAELIVQYKIKDAVKYLFNFVEPELTMREASEAALRTVIGQHSIDEALTTGKFQIQEETMQLIQSIVDKYETGILVVAVQLQSVSPPKEVEFAFKDVASAKEDKNRKINEAQGYRNNVIPKARGEAQAMLREAEAFKEARIKRAEGDVAKFRAMLVEYRKARDVTKKRLYLEAMEEILPGVKKYIVPSGGDGNLLNFLNLTGE